MFRLHKLRSAAVSVALLLISVSIAPLSGSVFAQATSGGLRGVVTDATGGVIPDAEVVVREAGTGVETRTRSNEEGIYTLAKLKPGKYVLTISKDGFRTQEFQDVDIILGQDQTIDAALQAGAPTEVVTVTAQGEELVQRETVQQSSQFEARKVTDLPSNVAGGGIDTLAILAPGVVPSFAGVANSNGQELSVNGNRPRSNNFSIDGQDNNDLTVAGPSFFVDNADIVAEYQVVTNNFSAEYGRNQGAVINIVTRAGSNDFHGTASWFHRDRKLFDSMTNIEKRSGRDDPPPFLYNVYGGTLGGPILKDRLFFFGSYQMITGRAVGLFESDNPTIAPEELGRLSAAFPNNPAIQALTQFSTFAVGNGVGTVSERTDRPRNETITLGGQTFRLAYPVLEVRQPTNQHEFSARGDWTINSKNNLWYRHLYQTADNKNALSSPTGSESFFGDVPASTHHGGANLTTQVGTNKVNEFRFAFTRLDVIFGGGCEGAFPGCIPDPVNNIGQTVPNIIFAGLRSSETQSTLQSIGPISSLPQGRLVNVYQFADNFSWTMGRHQLKMGADIRRLTNRSLFLPNINGTFRFNTAASVVENRPSTVQLAAGQLEISYNETDQFYYFQDDWRVKDNLTLNLGVRYEYTGQPINELSKISVERESDPSRALFRQDIPLENRTFPEIEADKNNWAPRLGFAWRPRMGDNMFGRMLFGEQDKTVISGGYSIAYDPAFYNLLSNIATSAPLVFLNTTANAATGPVTFPLPSTLTGEAVQAFATSNNIFATNLFDPRFFSQTTVAPNFHSPYSQQWSLRIQREVGANNVVEARYVGNKGTGLFQTVNRNPRIDTLINGFTTSIINAAGNEQEITFRGFPELVPSGLTPQVAGQGQCVDDPRTTTLNEAAQCNGRILPQGLIRSRENTANSTYHGLQTRFAGRLSTVSYGVSYTWSKSLDDASEVFSLFESAVSQSPFNVNSLERSNSLYDRRHALALNWVWDVPFFKGQEGIAGRALGGWQVNGTYYLSSGQRFTPSQFFNTFVFGQGLSYEDVSFATGFVGLDTLRPFAANPGAPRDQVGISQIDASLIFGVPVQNLNGFYSFNELNTTGEAVTVSSNDVRYIFNGPGAARIFGTPFGTATRNSEIGPRLNNLNLGLFKNFRITERVSLQFRTELFNALNHPNTGVGFIVNDVTPDIFVEDAGSIFNRRDEMEYARRAIQFGMKFIF